MTTMQQAGLIMVAANVVLLIFNARCWRSIGYHTARAEMWDAMRAHLRKAPKEDLDAIGRVSGALASKENLDAVARATGKRGAA